MMTTREIEIHWDRTETHPLTRRTPAVVLRHEVALCSAEKTCWSCAAVGSNDVEHVKSFFLFQFAFVGRSRRSRALATTWMPQPARS